MHKSNLACLSQPPELINRFVSRLLQEHQPYVGVERRHSARRPVMVPATVQPLNEELYPLRDPQHVVTRNISVGGVAFVDSQPMDAPFVSVHFKSPTGGELQLVAQVRHCTPQGKLFIIGCKFVLNGLSGQEGSEDGHAPG